MDIDPYSLREINRYLDVDSKISAQHVCRDFRTILCDEPIIDLSKFDFSITRLNDIIQDDGTPQDIIYEMMDNIDNLTLSRIIKLHPIAIFLIGCASHSVHLVKMVMPVIQVQHLLCGYSHAIIESDDQNSFAIAKMLYDYLHGSNANWVYWEFRLIDDFFKAD